MRRILVSQDDSVEAARAARWALDEAGRVGGTVEYCRSGTAVAGSSGASMLVVGLHGGPEEASGVVAHARCPVVVVRGTSAPRGPVVVGIDDTPTTERALAFAFGHAAAHGAPALAVQAQDPDEPAMAVIASTMCRLDTWHGRYPAIPVRLDLSAARPAEALVEASHDARLVVIGVEDRRRWPVPSLGPVVRHLLRNAACPVAVIHRRT
ncbi:universal stress protein [Actinoplanes sp. NPDC051851]|uniref:universal stress protein n=1 Tax=Actinoplanes sp. NPDC051851 TaxID=3154753 RepID=UPI003427858E